MSIRKLLILSFFLACACYTNAQTTSTMSDDWGWSWRDSAVVRANGKEQYVRFINNDFPYPPKPRSMWELGFGAGVTYIAGDVKGNAGFGGTITVRKAIDHTFSIRAGLTGMLNSGSPNAYGTAIGQVPYKNQTHQFSVDLLTSLNSSSVYRGNPKTNIYLITGYSLNAVKVLYKNPGGAQPGGYSIFYGLNNPNSQAGVVGTLGGAVINNSHAYRLIHGMDVGAGMAFKITKKVNIALEHKFTFTVPGYDLLDGYRGGNGSGLTSDDYYGFTSFRVNVNIGKPSTHVQPLWWLNKYNFIYNELNRPQHMKIPPPVLPDADGDGVTDQFDLEPNTPKGAPVDSHGRAKDTDGDGVPDYRDKEVLTPLSCFPVNNDGVGTCPEPACCRELRDMIKNMPTASVAKPDCVIGELPTIQFKKNAVLSADAKKMLTGVASRINANPSCKVKVIGYGAASKAAQQMSWDRVNAVIHFLVEKQGVAESRLLFIYEQDGDPQSVDLRGTMEEGPSYVPAPHPNLKSKM
jgi:outer membrane protein OmpA-like peptidoglycan-associated protein